MGIVKVRRGEIARALLRLRRRVGKPMRAKCALRVRYGGCRWTSRAGIPATGQQAGLPVCKALRDAVVDGSVRHLGSGSKFGRRVMEGQELIDVVHAALPAGGA